MKTLPIGIQSFEDLRNNNFLYVDKTKSIFQLITSGNMFFLSRPRRFGKSLLISALEAVFQGKKTLFQDLYIYDKIDWTKQNPVIRIDFSCTSHRTVKDLKDSLHLLLDTYYDKYYIKRIEAPLYTKFHALIASLHKSTGEKVVVLIDEYDKPITDNFNQMGIADEIRILLHDFYQVLKGSDEHLRFVFLTGVSKFAKVSVFSGLNNLRDITLSYDYATICGYTQEELEFYFEDHIEVMMKHHRIGREGILNMIRHWYDGYSWDAVCSVYNPFSTLLLFTEKDIRDYWFATGTPTFLVDLLKERNDVKTFLEPGQIQSTGFDSFDYKTLDTKLLLFQTGYITLKSASKNTFSEGLTYTLGIPNEEVRQAMLQYLVSSYSTYPVSDTAPMRDRMLQQLFDGDVQAFERNVQEMFAHIPYQLHIPREAYYHSLFLLWLNLLGFDVFSEISTDKGRIDAVWTWEDRVVIAEIKYSEQTSLETLIEEAFAQIQERRYYERYVGTNKKVAWLAVAFSGKKIACAMKE